MFRVQVLNFFLGCRKKAARRKITVAYIFDVLEIQGQENLLYETRVAGLECYFRFHSHRKCACIHLVSNVLQRICGSSHKSKLYVNFKYTSEDCRS
ncbi:hypothetical protein IMY05_018G0076300 [Salix suchowensis]|nr:hypothetical protein IMY05_018G0076300 [Salix suchowensis]